MWDTLDLSGLKHPGTAVLPEFHKALEKYVADSHLTITPVSIVAVARRKEGSI